MSAKSVCQKISSATAVSGGDLLTLNSDGNLIIDIGTCDAYVTFILIETVHGHSLPLNSFS